MRNTIRLIAVVVSLLATLASCSYGTIAYIRVTPVLGVDLPTVDEVRNFFQDGTIFTYSGSCEGERTTFLEFLPLRQNTLFFRIILHNPSRRMFAFVTELGKRELSPEGRAILDAVTDRFVSSYGRARVVSSLQEDKLAEEVNSVLGDDDKRPQC